MSTQVRKSRQQWKRLLRSLIDGANQVSNHKLWVHINEALHSLSHPGVEIDLVRHWIRTAPADQRYIRVPLSEDEANALVYGLDKCGVWKDSEASRQKEMRRLVKTLGYQLKVVPSSRALFIDEWLSNPLAVELGLWSPSSAKNHLTQDPEIFDKIIKYVRDKPLLVISVSETYDDFSDIDRSTYLSASLPLRAPDSCLVVDRPSRPQDDRMKM